MLKALHEVETALALHHEQGIRLASLLKAKKAATHSLDLSVNLYSQGLVDFENVLEAQQALFAITNETATAQGKNASGFVAICKALGGGWTSPSDHLTGAKGPHSKESDS